jgi:uncharacterized damage-inducible protein DinB
MAKPKYPTYTGTERELLEAHLEHNRLAVRHKVEGLSLELATMRLGSTPTSVAGLIKHLTEVEGWWFCRIFNGEDWTGNSTDENPDGEFDIGPDDSVESLLDDYDRACARSRSICKECDLDDVSKLPNSRNEHPSLRWVYLHMIEEIARHAGHLDIYRELLDGTTDRG